MGWSLWERMRMKREERRVTGGGRLEEHRYIRGNLGGREGREGGGAGGGSGWKEEDENGWPGGGVNVVEDRRRPTSFPRVNESERQKMRYNGTEEEVTLFRRGLSRSCEPSFQGGRGRMARPGPRWTGTGTGIEQWSVVDGSMGWQRTAQRIGNTGVPCGGQMEGLEGLGGVTQPGGAWLPVFARPAKKLASRAVGTCREGRCPFPRPRSSASCTRLGYHKKNKISSPSFDAILFCILVLQQCSCRRGVMLRGGVCSHWAIPSYRQETPPLIGRSPRLPSLRCRSDSRARFPLTTTLESKMVGGGLGGNDSHAFFFRPCPRLHHCFGRFGQWRVNMGGQTLQIGRKLVDATADPRPGRVRVRLSRGLGGTATRSRNAHWGRGRLVARHAAATRTRFLSIQRLSPSICLLLAMFPQVACPLCG